MRLSMPKVKEVVSEDGKSRLTFVTSIDTHTDSGDLYRFEIESPSSSTGRLVGAVLIDSGSGPSWMAEKKAREEGKDYDNMSLGERIDYLLEYSEKYGDLSYLTELELQEGELTPENIRLIRDTVCNLYLKLTASHEYNNDDPDSDPRQYYPDRIEFGPNRHYNPKVVFLPYVKTFYAPGAAEDD